MKVRGRHSVFAGVGVALLAATFLWMRHVPEPRYRGIRFGVFLDGYWKDREVRKTGREAMKEMGGEVVPYLVSQMEGDPVREFLFRIKPSMPDGIAAMFPSQTAYANRRTTAAGFLTEAGTNAISALPRLLALTEAEHPDYTHNFIRAVGMIAPGTAYEDRARKVLLKAIEGMQHERDRTTRRMAYFLLGDLGGSDAVPVLVAGLTNRGIVDACIDSLVKIGTNAIPALKEVAKEETGHTRPATLVLEKIEKKLSEERDK